LAEAGLPVPARLGGNAADIVLLEDLGSTTLQDEAAKLGPAARRRLYREVVGWVPVLQSLRDPGGLPAFGRRLEAAHYRYKADLLGRYGIPAPDAARRAVVAAAFEAIAAALADAPLRLAHRDLQSQNVLVRDGAPYMIDVQGALLAPPEYDLVCLLRDSYVELPEAEVADHLAWVRPRLPDAPDAETFDLRFDLLTVTRKGKDLARFVYAARERGDTRFLRYVPATWRILSEAAGRIAHRDSRWQALAELIAEGSPACAR
jgi:aminoglycoside/choline kinase family phosphotransferase